MKTNFHIKSDNWETFIFSYGKIMQAQVSKNEIPKIGDNPICGVESLLPFGGGGGAGSDKVRMYEETMIILSLVH